MWPRHRDRDGFSCLGSGVNMVDQLADSSGSDASKRPHAGDPSIYRPSELVQMSYGVRRVRSDEQICFDFAGLNFSENSFCPLDIHAS